MQNFTQHSEILFFFSIAVTCLKEKYIYFLRSFEIFEGEHVSACRESLLEYIFQNAFTVTTLNVL